MTRPRTRFSLPEAEYIKIFHIIACLQKCRTRQDINSLFASEIHPFFYADASLLGITAEDGTPNKLLDIVGYPEKDFLAIEKRIQFNPVVHRMIKINRQVVASGLDIPLAVGRNSAQQFFKHHPELKPEDYPYMGHTISMVLSESPTPEIFVGIERRIEKGIDWTYRDIRVAELLRPHLFQGVKGVYFNEELKKYRSISEVLGRHTYPLAVLSERLKILFRNPAFNHLFSASESFPKDLADLIKKELDQWNSPKVEDSLSKTIPFFKFKGEAFRLSLVPVSGELQNNEKIWALHMKPAVHPLSKAYISFHEAGLTGREIEICILVGDGFGNQEIAERLFISPNTVETHMKNIFKKLEIHNRAQLMALIVIEE